MYGKVKDMLSGVPSTARDNVVNMNPSDPHAPPRAWNTRYRESSEVLAYLEKIRADLTDFDVRAEETATALRTERIQRVAAINDAQRKLDDLHADIHQMAGNIGILCQETD